MILVRTSGHLFVAFSVSIFLFSPFLVLVFFFGILLPCFVLWSALLLMYVATNSIILYELPGVVYFASFVYGAPGNLFSLVLLSFY